MAPPLSRKPRKLPPCDRLEEEEAVNTDDRTAKPVPEDAVRARTSSSPPPPPPTPTPTPTAPAFADPATTTGTTVTAADPHQAGKAKLAVALFMLPSRRERAPLARRVRLAAAALAGMLLMAGATLASNENGGRRELLQTGSAEERLSWYKLAGASPLSPPPSPVRPTDERFD